MSVRVGGRLEMLRRTCNTTLLRCATSRRFGGVKAGNFDHSASFSRKLTESEAEALAAQKYRVVPGFVPGKLFMRHWVAGEQATVSIYNRGISVAVTALLVLGAGLYSTSAFHTESAWPFIFAAYFTYFLVLHTHMNEVYGAAAVLYAVYLALGY
jgi:hypothetical protein